MSSIFGSYRYEWIFKEYQIVDILDKSKTDFDSKLLQLLSSWDPCSEKLFHLKDTIEHTSPQFEVFPLSLICHCIEKLTIDHKHFMAWEIIDLMNSRVLRTAPSFVCRNAHSYTILIRNLEQIVFKMPNINILLNERNIPNSAIKSMIQSEVRIAKAHFLSTVGESTFRIFRIIIQLLENMKSIDDESHEFNRYNDKKEFYKIEFNNKTKLILLFFKNYWEKESLDTLLTMYEKNGNFDIFCKYE
jgi:hypothetical protein